MGALAALARRLRGGARGLRYFPVGGTCCLPDLAAGQPGAFSEAGWRRAPSPRQADLLLVAGPVNARLARVVAETYAQMPAPRRVLLVGDCPQAGYTRPSGAALPLAEARRVAGCPADPATVLAAPVEESAA